MSARSRVITSALISTVLVIGSLSASAAPQLSRTRTFRAEGTVLLPAPVPELSVTQTEFDSTCPQLPSNTQGLDAYVVAIPTLFGNGSAIANYSFRAAGVEVLPIYLEFVSPECEWMGLAHGWNIPVPADTKFVIVKSYNMVDTTFELELTVEVNRGR